MQIEKILTKSSVYQAPTVSQMQVIYALCHLNEKKEEPFNCMDSREKASSKAEFFLY